MYAIRSYYDNFGANAASAIVDGETVPNTVKQKIEKCGGQVHLNADVIRILHNDHQISYNFV